ncbi:MAG: sulfur carrier protein ThiS [Nitrospiraceae bacterium]|nr:sulfur carrier protein ThiS [Nitrospiraceae bacterium]
MSAATGITVNGKPAQVEEGSTLVGLAETLGLPDRGVAVALDGEIVPRSQWAVTLITEGSAVEVVSIAAGG